jgi:hypothetical protein
MTLTLFDTAPAARTTLPVADGERHVAHPVTNG